MTGRALNLLMRGLSMVLLALMSFLFAFWLRNHQSFPPGALTVVQYVDVVNGDCAAIRTVNGSIILFDTGSAATASRVIGALRAFHARRIDLLVLGASDDDSVGAVPAVIAAFLAVENNRFDASFAATTFYGMCGEIAEEEVDGPGSFKTAFINALHSIPTLGQYEKR